MTTPVVIFAILPSIIGKVANIMINDSVGPIKCIAVPHLFLEQDLVRTSLL